MSAGRRGILTGGTWCVDRNNSVDFWPGEDGLARIQAVERRGGGSGCNLACDIRRLDPGLPVETIGLVGDDDDGRYLLGQADAFGIVRDQIHVAAGATTHYTDCFISRRTGRRTHIFFDGTSALLTPEHFDFSATRMRIAHIGLPGVHARMDEPWADSANGWAHVLRAAQAAGLVTNLELASFEDAVIARNARPCLPYLDWLIVNDREMGAIAGEATIVAGETDEDALLRAMRGVMAAGAMSLVVAHFPLGALALTRTGEVLRRPSVAVPPEAVVSANGAGDGFAAGMLYALHEGWSLTDALGLAHATAAASLRAMSTVDGVESWQENLALAQRWGWRG